jgi:hypothetical protein
VNILLYIHSRKTLWLHNAKAHLRATS